MSVLADNSYIPLIRSTTPNLNGETEIYVYRGHILVPRGARIASLACGVNVKYRLLLTCCQAI